MKKRTKGFESFYPENQKPKRIDYIQHKKASNEAYYAEKAALNKSKDAEKGGRSFDKPSGDAYKKSSKDFDPRAGKRSFSSDKPFAKEFNKEEKGGRSFAKPFNKEGGQGERSFAKPFNKEGGRSFAKPFNKEGGRSFDKPFNKEGREGGRSFDKPFNKEGKEGGRSFDKPAAREYKPKSGDKPFGNKHSNASYGKAYGKKKDNDELDFDNDANEEGLEDFSYTPTYDDDETVRAEREEDVLIFGRNIVLESLERGEEFEKILILQGMRGEFEKTVRKICTERDIPLQVVPKEKLNAVTEKNHQGVIGFVSPIAYQELETIYKAAIEKNEVPLFVLLDGVTDVRNIGAVARSAEISGAHAIIVSKKNVAAINATAVKVSAGALKLIPVCRVSSLMAAVDFLQMQGAQVLAADVEAKKQLRHMDLGKPTAIVMGAEGRGINRDLMSKMNHIFKIPMVGKTESYNVSVATGIVLYEAVRQRLD